MIDQVKFEELIQQVIEGKISRKQISAQYHISPKTINSKIADLANTNPKLYQKFICKFPFKSKEITNINFVELTKKIMKEEGDIGLVTSLYDISERTFNRRLKKMENSSIIDETTGLQQKEIYNLYVRFRKKDLSFEDKKLLENMSVGNIVEKERNADRINFLKDLLQKYNQLAIQGMSKAQAAKILGYSYSDMCKKVQELKRIEIEQTTKQAMKDFKERIKSPNTIKVDIEKMNKKSKNIEIEKGEK